MGKKDILLRNYLGSKERFGDFLNGILFRGNVKVRSDMIQEMDSVVTVKDSERNQWIKKDDKLIPVITFVCYYGDENDITKD